MNINIPAIISSIGFSDVVDVLIISVLIYKLLGYLRNSRAAQLSKGLAFIIVAFFITDICHFYATRWIISQILNVGLIALVVVFQPELRRALEYMGRGKFLSSSQLKVSQERASEMVGDIVRAVDYFSQKKEGALIIIERNTALSDIAETGTIVDSRLSEQLIENIFYKGSPLHDGAAIIRGDRLYAAGCVLPLTENTNLSKDLGTRHRAGIGISEVSDAIVLIVSEETGIISMAQDGKLSRFLDLRTVEKTLLAHYLKQKEGEVSSRDLISKLLRKGGDANGTKENN